MSLAVVILAAGKGTRMRSRLPKVLHELAGRPLLQHVVDSARALHPEKIVVVHGHGGDRVQQRITGNDITWVEQTEQLGTGHAVAQAMPELSQDKVLVLYGDVPLIRPFTLEAFVASVSDQALALMTLEMEDPGAYGRIVRDEQQSVQRIVEYKDASDTERAIREINTGIVAATRDYLNEVLPELSSENAQGEYYLTDIIAMAVARGLRIEAAQPEFSWEVDGVNDRVQLARLERVYQGVLAETLMRSGVSLADPARIDIRGHLDADEDVFIDVNGVFEGDVKLGSGTRIGANCVLINCRLGENVTVLPNSHLEGVVADNDITIGPFARLREGTELAEGSKIGNFVETKKSQIGPGSKVNHLTYIGDTQIGAQVNVGAGTITCNYDGVNKFQTVLEDGAFIGSNSSLVAPVTVGKDATVGAGSTINKDVPPGQLAVARGKQRNIEGWQRPKKDRS
jgi:bifunctional UDP-N-acetylglucosamine pyrophosphorylase/glucosamine-1-phosphate N-acetyltransferase